MGSEENRLHGGNHPIARLASRQYGLVTRSQLLGLGVAIDSQLRRGALVAAHRGVYWVKYPHTDPITVSAAAVLAGGPHAVLSHSSAAVLWELAKGLPELPEITLVQGDRRPRNVQVHTSRSLTEQDIRRHQGIRATTPARTLLDTAKRLPARTRTRAVNDARVRGCLHLDALKDVLERNPGHPGTPLLTPFVQDSNNPTGQTSRTSSSSGSASTAFPPRRSTST